MLTLRNRQLLAAADPWGLETGGCPGTGERWESFGGLGAAGDVPLIGGEVATLETSGEKISAGMEAGDINAVAKGAEEGIEAVASGYAKLEGAWNDAQKFFMSVGGTITVPSIGKKGPGLPMWAESKPPNIDWTKIAVINVTTPESFINAVSQGYLFYGPDWARFGLAKPVPGGTKGQVWNPFSNRWQKSGFPLPIPGTPTAIELQEEAKAITAYQGDTTQRDVDKFGKDITAYLALARTRVQAEQYKAAIQGHIYQGRMPWGLVPLIVIVTNPFNAVMIAEGRRFSHGPFKGQTWRKKRIQWIKELAATIRQMPADLSAQLGPAGAKDWLTLEEKLATATVDGTTSGTRVLDTDASGRARGRGGAAVAAVGAAAGLGLLWFLLA